MKLKLLSLIIVVMLLFTGCGNQQILDTKWTFDKAKINLFDEIIEVRVMKWGDYEGDSVQVIDEDGNIYLTSYVNVVLMK